ncbi:alpha/beta fold hydrolase [Gilvimarinus xylanilyticus]|uniref:Alpha/beta hydrolase n=1 Tax=Gilvimarinus xylanilyticus TaxID=2944139 RepID=A0A9X2KTP6_9GAMM|nr:alpha/beta hydrolase [Gilvimarinus xylanilyticus]
MAQATESLTTEQLYNRALTLWGEDYQELQVPTSYGAAQVVVSGPEDGYPVVLLHGMNTNSTMWYPNASELARDYRVYAVDYILGHGKSKPKEGLDELEPVLKWYGEVFTALKLERFALVGASQGGWFATQIALREPNRVSHLVLLSPAQTFGWVMPGADVLKNLAFALDPEESEVKETLQTMSTNVDKIDPLYIDQFYRYSVENQSVPELLTEMQPFEDKRLAELTMPMLVLIGEQDIINSPESLERAREVLPCVRAAVVANAGHFVNVDAARSVNQRMLSFLETEQGDEGACPLSEN